MAAMAEGLALERPPAAGPIDVALACGVWESRPRVMTTGDWLSELDPNDEIAALPSPVREELVGDGAAWPNDYVVVKGCSEGAAIPAGGHGGGRRRTQGQGRVLCPAGVAARRLRAADAAQRASAEGRRKLRLENLRGTAKALLDGRALETIPIMEYVWERTNRVLANEELLPGRERADGRHVGEERNGACGVLGTSRQGGRMTNDIDRWRQVPPGYGSRPVAMR